MHGAITPLFQYAFIAWCSAESQGNFNLPVITINLISTVYDFKYAPEHSHTHTHTHAGPRAGRSEF
jgi:hypothetical protein